MRRYHFFILNIFYLIFISKIEGIHKYEFPIFQSDECRPSKLAILHPKYDSHLTWVLSPTCDLAVKYNWDTGIFEKSRNLKNKKLESLSGNCSNAYDNEIFTNFDNGTLFFIFVGKQYNIIQSDRIYFDVVVVDTVELWNSEIPYINILNDIPENGTMIKKLTLMNFTVFNNCIGNKDNIKINIICISKTQKSTYEYLLTDRHTTTMTLKEIIDLDVTLMENQKYYLHYYNDYLYILYKSKYIYNDIIYAHKILETNCKEFNECHPGFLIPPYNEDDFYYDKIISIRNEGIIYDICIRLSGDCISYFLPDNKNLDSHTCTHAKAFNGLNFIISGVIPISNHYIGLFSSLSSDLCSVKKSYISQKYLA